MFKTETQRAHVWSLKFWSLDIVSDFVASDSTVPLSRIFPQPINTPGTEIAPGSNIVRIDFKNHWHFSSFHDSSFFSKMGWGAKALHHVGCRTKALNLNMVQGGFFTFFDKRALQSLLFHENQSGIFQEFDHRIHKAHSLRSIHHAMVKG